MLVERDRAALEAIDANLEHLGLGDRGRASSRADVGAVPRRGPAARTRPFDLVFVDPPYDTADEDVTELLAALDGARVARAATRSSASSGRARHPVVAPAGLSTGWERTFGDTLLSFVFRDLRVRLTRLEETAWRPPSARDRSIR